ncbi:DUF814 domain-containing protein [Candidatus Woesearchaeota archaeon]|nr:DUF814 domain-containing protein [Candidatus Woesearchaeota archaeon]MBI2574727.1 DUF814 domain-containing protein [Candidatus Woesearchaeota archaeon]
MKLTLDITKSPEQNSALYYEKAKKAKRKLEGAEKALAESRKKLAQLLQKKQLDDEKAQKSAAKARDRKWFEKFRWFVSSEGMLVAGGRDATTNEIIIKKHTETGDLVFHTDMAGSPFFVVKTEGKKPGDETITEAATATASFSRAWRLGLSVLEVFHVDPDQVSKTAKSGEYMGKGAFMIYGKTNYITAELKLAIGVDSEGRVMCGPVAAIKKNCGKYAEIIQSRDKTSDTAKKIRRIIGGELDDIIAALPSGGCRVKA